MSCGFASGRPGMERHDDAVLRAREELARHDSNAGELARGLPGVGAVVSEAQAHTAEQVVPTEADDGDLEPSG